MTTEVQIKAAPAETKLKSAEIVPNIISGLATGLFSIPEGMAYAQLAGVNPIYGMYSGVVATMVASLSTGTVLMMSTLTSAIALTTGSVLQNAGIQSGQMPQALFTITFLTGAIMFVLGILRLGSIVNFVSNAVYKWTLMVIILAVIVYRFPIILSSWEPPLMTTKEMVQDLPIFLKEVAVIGCRWLS